MVEELRQSVRNIAMVEQLRQSVRNKAMVEQLRQSVRIMQWLRGAASVSEKECNG